MIIDGAVDDIWGVQKNWKNLQKDDRIWVYYGTADGDLGVVGLGYVRKVEEPQETGTRAQVTIQWDIPKTRKLMQNPFPALTVRKSIPRAQGTVWRIESALSKQLLNHVGSKKFDNKPTAFKGRYATGATSTISYTPPKKVNATRRHDSVLRTLQIRLQSNGWTEVEIKSDSKRVDLAMRKGPSTIIIEAKTITNNSMSEVRAAFAQLTEYSWRHLRNSRTELKKPILWAFFESEPKQDEIEFLEDHSILVSWISCRDKRIIHSRKTIANSIVKGL
jgi:hypothetical protein